MRQAALLLIASACCWTVAAQAQDAPSLGDVARQARQQKQQKEAANPSTAKTSVSDNSQNSAGVKPAAPKSAQVISNEDLPEHTAPAAAPSRSADDSSKPESAVTSGNQDDRAEQIKSEIQSQKSAIASLKQEMDSFNDSIHFAGGNCVANCAQWNERQKEKQVQVESMKAQLEEQQKRLEEMQEAARKQGFGSAVYDP